MQISSNLHSNVSRSTRINSSSVHTYIFRLFYFACNSTRVCDPKCNMNYQKESVGECYTSLKQQANRYDQEVRALPFFQWDDNVDLACRVLLLLTGRRSLMG